MGGLTPPSIIDIKAGNTTLPEAVVPVRNGFGRMAFEQSVMGDLVEISTVINLKNSGSAFPNIRFWVMVARLYKRNALFGRKAVHRDHLRVALHSMFKD